MIKNLSKSIKIGKNNFISSNVIIHDNVIIGNNNKIYDDVIIYPNTVIGDNNKILPRNIIGEYAVSSDEKFNDYDFKDLMGVYIGNNNFLHVSNIIFSGINNKTQIGNCNKFLAENHIGHDAKIFDSVTFYPRCIAGGYSVYLDNSNIGMGAKIQQKTIVGQFSMVGANNIVTKNIFPYYISINNKLHRLNEKKIGQNFKQYDNVFRQINDNFIIKNYDIDNYDLPEDVKDILNNYIKFIR